MPDYNSLKMFIKRIPVIGTVLRAARVTVKKATFPGSRAYWEANYANQGTSGEGSYGMFAEFKAEILNDLVSKLNIASVIEWGCGDGNQLSLVQYPQYIGLDVSHTAIQLCKTRFANDRTKSFFWYDPEHFIDNANIFCADLALSLDVIYHLIEDELFELYMKGLFDSARKYVLVYSSNTNETPYLEAAHYKNRHFTEWITKNRPNWSLIQNIPNRYPFTGDPSTGSASDFYLFQKQ